MTVGDFIRSCEDEVIAKLLCYWGDSVLQAAGLNPEDYISETDLDVVFKYLGSDYRGEFSEL